MINFPSRFLLRVMCNLNGQAFMTFFKDAVCVDLRNMVLHKGGNNNGIDTRGRTIRMAISREVVRGAHGKGQPTRSVHTVYEGTILCIAVSIHSYKTAISCVLLEEFNNIIKEWLSFHNRRICREATNPSIVQKSFDSVKSTFVNPFLHGRNSKFLIRDVICNQETYSRDGLINMRRFTIKTAGLI